MDKVLCLGIGFGLGCFYMKHKMENKTSIIEETKETFSNVLESTKEKIHNATAPEKVEPGVTE